MSQNFADSNRARLRLLKEDDHAWGATPATGRAREVRYTGSTINANKQTVASDEIRADRMVSDHVETGANSAGDIQVEFSAGSHDDLMESFCYGAWTRPMTFDAVKGTTLEWANASTLYVKGKDVTNYFFAGRRVRTQGFENVLNNDYFQISTVTWNAGANRTEFVMVAASAAAEKGSAFTTLFDANDVIVLKNTGIRAGTAGDASFDSNGGNAFAAAIAAGQLNVGQKIFVEGLGFETGTVAFTGNPAVGTKVTVDDGAKTLVFQFGGIGANAVILVDIGTGNSATADNFAAAVNQQRVRGELAVSATVAGSTVTLKNLNVTGGSVTEANDTGNALTVTAFSGGNASLRGVFKIEAMTDDKLSVSPAPATFANGAALAVTIKGSMLRNPHDPAEITPQSFSIETGFEDVDQFFITDGLRVGTLNYDIASNAILKGSYGFNGRATKRSPVTKLGAAPYTVLETTATLVANATTNVGVIKLNGEALSTAVQSISLQGNNALRDQNAVGNKFPAGIGAGRMEITGNLVAYFADGTMWDKFIEHQTVSVEFNIEDVEGHHYEFTIPAANFSTDTVNPAGGNQDIMENMAYQAKRDPVTDCQIQIDRFSCVQPPTA
jgi:hypothetical protein